MSSLWVPDIKGLLVLQRQSGRRKSSAIGQNHDSWQKAERQSMARVKYNLRARKVPDEKAGCRLSQLLEEEAEEEDDYDEEEEVYEEE